LKREDLDEFVQCYKGENLPASHGSAQASRYQRQPTWCEEGDGASSAQGASPAGRWRAYDFDELINRDKASLDIFWLRDESLEESDNLPDPDVLAQEIVEDLEAALEQFREIAADLGGEVVEPEKS
jgi:type I restriction enzyme M protein